MDERVRQTPLRTAPSPLSFSFTNAFGVLATLASANQGVSSSTSTSKGGFPLGATTSIPLISTGISTRIEQDPASAEKLQGQEDNETEKRVTAAAYADIGGPLLGPDNAAPSNPSAGRSRVRVLDEDEAVAAELQEVFDLEWKEEREAKRRAEESERREKSQQREQEQVFERERLRALIKARREQRRHRKPTRVTSPAISEMEEEGKEVSSDFIASLAQS